MAPRASDIAREALRASREDARRAREETENEGARRRRGARQRRVDERAAAARRARGHAVGGEARDVRQLLSDTFRMPGVPGDPDVTPEGAGAAGGPVVLQEGAGAAGDLKNHPGPEGADAAGDRGWAPGGAGARDLGPGPEGADAAGDLGPAPGGAGAAGDLGPGPEGAGAAGDLGPGPEGAGAAGDLGWAPGSAGAEGDLDPGAEGASAAEDQDTARERTDDPGDPDPAPLGSDQAGHRERPGSGSPRSAAAPATGGTPAPATAGTHARADTATPPPHGPGPSTAPPSARRSADSPHTPRAPHSMAAPGRDNELRRTFPAFPPREPDGDGFAESWWGNAWVAALEQGALDVKRLERGRGYAGQGHVDAITVTPGLVLAYVRGSRPRPYRVQVRLRTLDESDWERFLDAAADRPGHIAALLDKELPQSLADCGVPLLPRPGDLEPRCSCPDRGHPCKHAAALCYQTARLLDADPFVLLLLRGRGERELLDALSRLSATRAARAAQDREPAPLPGVRAKEALEPRTLPPLPAPLPPPPHPEQPPAYPASPGGPDPFALDQLATDAAARAHALLTTGCDPVGQLTLWEDAVRLAAARPGSGLTAGTRALYSSLASAAGRTPSELARAVAAWRQGGPEGLAVLEEPWDPPAGRFDRARPLLLAADLPAFRPWRNHLTHPQGHVQLRLGRDGLWYAYESEPGRDDWWPRGTPDLDPVGALTGLGIPGDL
nr:SWIM zinc finger family protein [Streptomyces sp. NRRL S-474]